MEKGEEKKGEWKMVGDGLQAGMGEEIRCPGLPNGISAGAC